MNSNIEGYDRNDNKIKQELNSEQEAFQQEEGYTYNKNPQSPPQIKKNYKKNETNHRTSSN